jgi:alpha-L-rhamnosidase
MNDPGMNSFNHYAYGAVAAWIYGYAAGIDATSDDPGFHSIYLHPHFSRALGTLDLTYETPYGKVHSAWSAPASGAVKWNLTIPANADGYLQLTPKEAARYTMDGHALRAAASNPERYEVPSGSHLFTVAMP